MSDLISREAVIRSMTGLVNSHRLVGEFGLTEAVFDRIRALPAGKPAVKVRPLAWNEYAEGEWDAVGLGIDYSIARTSSGLFCMCPCTGDTSDYLTLEGAQAAAQSDYEARILEALEGGAA